MSSPRARKPSRQLGFDSSCNFTVASLRETATSQACWYCSKPRQDMRSSKCWRRKSCQKLIASRSTLARPIKQQRCRFCNASPLRLMHAAGSSLLLFRNFWIQLKYVCARNCSRISYLRTTGYECGCSCRRRKARLWVEKVSEKEHCQEGIIWHGRRGCQFPDAAPNFTQYQLGVLDTKLAGAIKDGLGINVSVVSSHLWWKF